MFPVAGIGSLNPGPPSIKGSPMQVVRRTRSYVTRKATKPMKSRLEFHFIELVNVVAPRTRGVGDEMTPRVNYTRGAFDV
jgi:hypothetical protein